MKAAATGLAAWFPYRRVKDDPEARLFCFAHAGGSASVFRDWADRLPQRIEVCAVQLPGREARLMEKPFTHVDELMDAMIPAIAPLLDRRFAFLGYSMGAAIAWESACRIERTLGVSPIHLFACARRAPHLPSLQQPIHQLPEPAFKQKLRALGGTPEEALNNAELLNLILPVLRADFELNDTYLSAAHRGAVSCPVTVFGGDADAEVSPQSLDAWRESTRAAFSIRSFPGGHFFLKPNLESILAEVLRSLRPAAFPAASG